ncbi:MAG: metallophosphoesterase family protein [Clostridia bacterium]|nr:metallophosphoesterase family protein [Clostridia bacterium]
MDNAKDRTVQTRPRRKHVVLRALLAVLFVLLAAGILTVGVNIAVNRNFTVSFYSIRCDKVSDNIRIIELADLHNKEFGENNEKLVRKIESLHPDLIVYAGDMMNYQDDDYSVLFTLSDQLSEIAPIYACYGNNELDQFLFRDRTFTGQLAEHNVRMLSNEALIVEVGGSVVQLIAVSDDVKQFDVKTNNAKKFLDSLDPTSNCRICLTHYPELFLEKLLDRGIDVAFTGHAHGGLIRLPRIGGLYSSGEGFLPEFTSGVVQTDDGAQVVVSRGLGNSGFIPRINNQPELVVTDICWY